MIILLLHLLRLLPFLCGGHRQLAVENLALRQQLAVYMRTATRPQLRRRDRLFWVCLSRTWPAWRQALVIVAPDTVLRWQRLRFRRHWAKLSGRPPAGRPPVTAEIKALVARLATANPLWGAPRIHGELLKLGIDVAETHRLAAAPEAGYPALSDLADVPDQSRPGLGLDRFLHRAHRAPPRPLRPRRSRPPSPARRPFQRDRAPHRPLHRPADRGRVPGRLRAALSPARPRPGLRPAVSAPREGPGDRRSPHGAPQPLAESFRRAPHRLEPARVSESRPRSRRKTPPPHPGPLLRRLSPGSHSSLARQRCAGHQGRRAVGGGRSPCVRPGSASWPPDLGCSQARRTVGTLFWRRTASELTAVAWTNRRREIAPWLCAICLPPASQRPSE